MSVPTFMPLQIADSALNASTIAMNVAANNVSNANTPGYAVETVNQQTAIALPTFTDTYTYIGEGVNTTNVKRASNQYVNNQYRQANAQQSYWQSMSDQLSNIQTAFNEPNGSSVRSAMDSFFSSFNQLSQTPNSASVRQTVLDSAKNLVSSFGNLNQVLSDQTSTYQGELKQGISQVNQIATSIAQLNVAIEKQQQTGTASNSLLDQRSVLLDKLSQYVPVNVAYGQNPQDSKMSTMTISYATVNSSGQVVTQNLVQDGQVTGLTASNVAALQNTQSGSLSAFNNLISYTGNLQNQMNSVLNSVATDVNNQLAVGYAPNSSKQGGMPLFNISAKGTVTYNSSATVNGLAAASSPATAASGGNATDGGNALLISNLATTKNYDQSYAGYVAQVGVDTQNATNEAQTFASMVTQASNMKTSVSGVNINQEMTNIVQSQQIYTASAKLISVYNQMLNTLIQNT